MKDNSSQETGGSSLVTMSPPIISPLYLYYEDSPVLGTTNIHAC